MSIVAVTFIALCAVMVGLGLGEIRVTSLKKKIMEARRLRELKREVEHGDD